LYEKLVLLAGKNIIVEVGESVLSRRGIIKNPTITSELIRYTV